jgi:hypothetical protein
VPAARLLSCPSIACRRNAFRVFLYDVRQNAAGDQLLTCLSCGYEAVFRAGSGQFEPRPGRPVQDWRPPQPLDPGNPTQEGETKKVETKTRRRVAGVTDSTQAQRTLTARAKENIEMPFKSGHTKQGGRKAGTPNKLTGEAREVARRLLAGAEYQRNLQKRLSRGEAPRMELHLWELAYGKPRTEADDGEPKVSMADLLEESRKYDIPRDAIDE